MKEIRNIQEFNSNDCFWDYLCSEYKVVDNNIDCFSVDARDKYLDRAIEEGRIRYRKEWFNYVVQM